ncbi:MAG TPA: 2-phospho-L-lactate guanylyltransferase [Terriglobales bacterium]
MILVPVKDSSGAKQRLAGLLDQPARTQLARAMLRDVLDSLAQYGSAPVAVVTRDPVAIELARYYSFEVIRDDANAGETDAIAMATGTCLGRGMNDVLVIPGDIPLIEAGDLRAIYEAAPSRGSVLVPAADKRGTNAALRRPASLFPLRFGNDSFMPHLSAAINADASCVVLSLPRIALDIDTPRDLANLANAPGEKLSQQLARKLILREASAIESA